jgi:hypothetical protein
MKAEQPDVLPPGDVPTFRDMVLAVRLPVPLNRVARYLRGWSKKAYTVTSQGWLVVIDPERSSQ